MHNRQQKGKRNMSQNVLVVHGGGPTAVINASLYGVIEEEIRRLERFTVLLEEPEQFFQKLSLI